MTQGTMDAYSRILKKELVAAMGCTEPIAIAYAAAKCRQVLGKMPDHCRVHCSGNIVKNVMGVTVPNSGGLKGIDVAATLGILGGNADKDLEVLESVTEAHIAEAKGLLERGFCSCALVQNVENLYILIHLTAGDNSAVVEIRNYHKNITRIEKNGKLIYQQEVSCNEVPVKDDPDKAVLNIADILEYGNTLTDPEILELLEYQLQCNLAIAWEGLANNYGAQVGKTLLSTVKVRNTDTVRTIAKAYAAAGSDARMNGCAMPVVINSGSGNQGLTASLPVKVYADTYHISHERMMRALAVSNLIAIHQKQYIGSLSAYCGAVSAACGAGAAIAYMLGEAQPPQALYRQVCDTITNTIATVGGMVCDGAKSSCAAKIATAVDCAVTGYELSLRGLAFQPGEGLVMDSVEDTIESVGRMGREGMHSTDVEILQIMLGEE
ncbi:MAG: serine dehydratase subunit alpha family protein [Oscillospiraceae bacterium]|nr:serine dehydratase subunit alpha family protein [Oscillospiraceae bacterium]